MARRSTTRARPPSSQARKASLSECASLPTTPVPCTVSPSTSSYPRCVSVQLGVRPGTGFLPLGIAGLTWSARNLNLLLLDFGTTSETLHRAFDYATFTGHGLFLGLFGIFLLGRYDTVISPRLARHFRLTIHGSLAMSQFPLPVVGGTAP